MPTHLGHLPVGKRPNIRVEIDRVKRDPLKPYIEHLGENPTFFLSTDLSRYCDAYNWYFLSLRRFLTSMSIVARYRNTAYYARKYSCAYTPYERMIATKYRNIAPYFELDITNCILHARILLDRVSSLSRKFLRTGSLPSFTSFSDHKKFFQKLAVSYGQHESYADYIRNSTPWFEMPLKEVRDKYVVHSAPKHSRFVGLPNNWEVELIILRADGVPPEKPFHKSTPIVINILRMSYDLEAFLDWFCRYAIAATNAP